MSSPDCQALFTAIVENGGKVWGLKSNVADDDEPKRKGCDIGYALVADSCEGTDNVDTCTVTALGCDHCFRSSKPRRILAESVGFFGSGRSSGYPSERITQPTSDQQVLFS